VDGPRAGIVDGPNAIASQYSTLSAVLLALLPGVPPVKAKTLFMTTGPLISETREDRSRALWRER